MIRRIPDELTVGSLLDEGVEDVDAFCVRCGHMWRAPIMFLPRATTLSKVEALMACPVCGGRVIEVEPSADRVQ